MLSVPVYSHLLVKTLLKMAQGTPVGDEWVAKQLEKYALNFDEADTDKNGSLRFREIVFALVKGGFRGSYNEAKTIFQTLDENSDKAISREEYLRLVKSLDTKDLKEMAMRREFKLIDADGSGALTREEIMNAITNAELDPKAENMSNLLIALISDADKKLSYEEFLKAWAGQFDKKSK